MQFGVFRGVEKLFQLVALREGSVQLLTDFLRLRTKLGIGFADGIHVPAQ